MRSSLASAYANYTVYADAGTINDLYKATTSYAHSVAHQRGLKGADAADVAQETAITVWQRLHTYDPSKSSFSTWVYRITLDRIADWRRREFRQDRSIEAQHVEVEEVREVDPACIRAICEAAGPNRELADLVLELGDIAEAAEALGITAAAAQKRLARIASKINPAERPNAGGF